MIGGGSILAPCIARCAEPTTPRWSTRASPRRARPYAVGATARRAVTASPRSSDSTRSPLVIVKSDGRREPFDRGKIVAGITAATKGRHVDQSASSRSPRRSTTALRLQGAEVTSGQIGLAVLDRLRTVDEVAYLRFASVYKNFDAATDFHREIELLTKAAAEA